MNSGLIGVLAGVLTSLAIKGVDLALTHEKDKRAETVQDRDRLSSDIWKLLGELRSDYARLDTELKDERTARHQAEEQARALEGRVGQLQEQVARQEAKTEKYKVLAEERLSKIASLTKAVVRLQARVNELEARDRTDHSTDSSMIAPPMTELSTEDAQDHGDASALIDSSSEVSRSEVLNVAEDEAQD